MRLKRLNYQLKSLLCKNHDKNRNIKEALVLFINNSLKVYCYKIIKQKNEDISVIVYSIYNVRKIPEKR